MNPDSIVYGAAIWLIPLVIAIVFHEVAHGLAARALGDPTAAERKRLSLNPIRHVDPIGTIVLPLILALTKMPVSAGRSRFPSTLRGCGTRGAT